MRIRSEKSVRQLKLLFAAGAIVEAWHGGEGEGRCR
jgi:hypothetical protein